MRKMKSQPELKMPTRSKEIPASQGMLQLVRSELKADIRSLRSEVQSGFKLIDSKFIQMDSKFSQMDSKFERVISEVARVGSLVEEQNSRNQVVLESLTSLYQRQDRMDLRTEEVQNLIHGLAARSRR